jgi:hypothetical protein
MTRSRRSDRLQLELGEQQPALEEAVDEDGAEDEICNSPERCPGPEGLERGELTCWPCWNEAATEEQRETYMSTEAAGQPVGVTHEGP